MRSNLSELEFVQIGLKIGHQHTIRTFPVAQAKLKAEIVAQKDEPSEDFIVSNQPWGEHEKENRG